MGAVERIEKNKVKITFEATPEEFKKGLLHSYNKNKGQVNIPGFRKGKAPRKVIERMFGADFFYDDAVNHVLPDAYESAVEEGGISPVYKPSIKLLDASEESGVFFEAEVFVKPDVSIDGYYGLTYVKSSTEATDSEVQAKLSAEREKNARQVSKEGPAANGDIVTINFTGYADGAAFEGGTGKDYDLTLGSDTFVPGFEEQLIGRAAGDSVDVEITFPEDYSNPDLAGKEARFEVEVQDVLEKDYPEIDDEFAQDVSEFETLEEYRASIAAKIKADKERNYEASKRASVMTQLANKAVVEVPEVMYTARVDEMMEEMRYRLSQQGMNMEMFMNFSQQTEEQIRGRYETQAREEVNATLALEAVAKKEGLEAGDDEYREYLEKRSEQGGVNVDELIKRIEPERKKEIIQEIINKKAMDFVMDKAVAIDGDLTVK
ncbi:MAG: trigger factor [Defluviitaleaceae bacterium]|nr:trigger factor [Defluviitaleaceae bacterium]